MNNKLIYEDLTYKINGILLATHNELGRGCNEKQYCDFIEGCLMKLTLKYEREKVLPVSFVQEGRGRNKIDFLIENEAPRSKLRGIFSARKIIHIRRFSSAQQATRYSSGKADKIILEIKAKRFLTREDYYQIKRYLVAYDKKLGITVNFRQKYIKPKRILNSLAKE